MTAPRLCVAMPVLNGENFIAEAIESVLAQTFKDFVLVIAENASTDRTIEIVERFARQDSRVKLYSKPERIVQAENQRRAMELAPGRWVKLLCHDDLMREDCLEQVDALIERIDESDVGLICNGRRDLYANGYITPDLRGGEPWIIPGRTVVRQFFAGTAKYGLPAVTTATVRKASWEAIGGYDSRFEGSDTYCWLRLLVDYDLAQIPDTLTTVRLHPGQVGAAARRSLRKMRDYGTFVPEYLSENADRLGLSWSERLRANGMPVNAAAKALVVEMRAGRFRGIPAMVRQVPAKWLPALPPLMVRTWLRERRRLAHLVGHVPKAMINP